MISHLTGKLNRIRKDSLWVMVETKGGVGYDVLLPYFVKRTLEEKGEGDEIELEIYYYVTERQPRPILIGFNREHEKAFFERLVAVEDIGPVRAANALIFSVSTIARAVEAGDIDSLKKLPGIGERTAAKIVATLQGKVAQWALLQDEGYDSVPTPGKEDASRMRDDLVEALVGLGYRRNEARAKVEEAMSRNPKAKDEGELIREVFRGERR